MKYEELPQYCLSAAAGRIKTLLELWEHRGETVWFVAQGVENFSTKEKAFRGYSQLIPWKLHTVARQERSCHFVPFTPEYEISPDVRLHVFEREILNSQFRKIHGPAPYRSHRALSLENYNCHGMCGIRNINNAVFATREEAEQYQIWLKLRFENHENPWNESTTDEHLGIMTIGY